MYGNRVCLVVEKREREDISQSTAEHRSDKQSFSSTRFLEELRTRSGKIHDERDFLWDVSLCGRYHSVARQLLRVAVNHETFDFVLKI